MIHTCKGDTMNLRCVILLVILAICGLVNTSQEEGGKKLSKAKRKVETVVGEEHGSTNIGLVDATPTKKRSKRGKKRVVSFADDPIKEESTNLHAGEPTPTGKKPQASSLDVIKEKELKKLHKEKATTTANREKGIQRPTPSHAKFSEQTGRPHNIQEITVLVERLKNLSIQDNDYIEDEVHSVNRNRDKKAESADMHGAALLIVYENDLKFKHLTLEYPVKEEDLPDALQEPQLKAKIMVDILTEFYNVVSDMVRTFDGHGPLIVDNLPMPPKNFLWPSKEPHTTPSSYELYVYKIGIFQQDCSQRDLHEKMVMEAFALFRTVPYSLGQLNNLIKVIQKDPLNIARHHYIIVQVLLIHVKRLEAIRDPDTITGYINTLELCVRTLEAHGTTRTLEFANRIVPYMYANLIVSFISVLKGGIITNIGVYLEPIKLLVGYLNRILDTIEEDNMVPYVVEKEPHFQQKYNHIMFG